MANPRPSLGNPARKKLPKYKRLLSIKVPEDWAPDDNFYVHKVGVYEEVGDVVVGCLWKREHELAEHPLAVRRQVVGRMFGPKAETNYRNPLDPDEILHQDTRGARRQDTFVAFKRVPLIIPDGARVCFRGRTDQRHGPQSDPDAGDNQNTSWVRGTLYKEGVRAKGHVQDVVPATRTRFATALEQLSPCWENHRIRFVTGPNKNFETYVLDYTRLNEEEPGIIVLPVLLPHEPLHGDAFVLMRDNRRTVRWRAPYRAATDMWEYAYQCEPIEGGKMESPRYIGVRWSDVEGQRVQLRKGSTVPNPPAVGAYWLPSHCESLSAYPYGSQNHNWMFPDSFFDPLYRQAFWAPDLGAWDVPGGRIPGVLYKAIYGVNLYGKGNYSPPYYEHPLGRDAETDEIISKGILVGSVPDPITSGHMNWYMARVTLWFEWPFYLRDESDPDPGTGQPRWAGFWPAPVSGGITYGHLEVTFVCIHTTRLGNRRIFGKYGDEYAGYPVPHLGMHSVWWGILSPSTQWSVTYTPFPTPAGHQEYSSGSENQDAANMVLPYRGPCCVASRGRWWVDPDYYDVSYDDSVYYPCGVHLL